MKTDRAPIFRDAYQLCQWCLRNLGTSASAVGHSTCEESLAVLDAVTLALKNRERDVRLLDADEHLIQLRLRLRLAHDVQLLQERQLLFALDLADRIGRQIGGWQKAG